VVCTLCILSKIIDLYADQSDLVYMWTLYV
jgi:hypothetical protein